eukprot:CAMPEP_0197075546 /NCGR_PEP_ID=MMETSP1384-20130603/211665_1 /TAXON_ID=29189 /ORGANISM="Ammonia sp." /LENGTH=747 /DNA_ID=CAMNT_0042514395 /DNA_START=71 /DNA_END=2315 /DNA_ORIENTATION=-
MADKKEAEKTGFQAKSVYLVDVSIIRGINLPKADTVGQSDGFVKVSCEAGGIKRKFRTIVVKNTLDPQWDAKTQFHLLAEPKEVLFRVFDWNRPPQSDTKLGNYTLNLAGYFKPTHPGFAGRVTLNDVKRGEIEIKVNCRRIEVMRLLTQTHPSLLQSHKINLQQIAEYNQQISDAKKERQTLQQEVARCQTDHDTLDQQRREAQEELDRQLRKGKKLDDKILKLQQGGKSLEEKLANVTRAEQEEYQRYNSVKQQLQAAEQRKHGYTDTHGQHDLSKVGVSLQVDAYVQFLNINEDDIPDNEKPIDFDAADICKQIITAYRQRYVEAQQLRDSEDEQDDEAKQSEPKLARAERKAREELNTLHGFRQQCAEILETKKAKYVQEYNGDNQKYGDFFPALYDLLWKFFIDLHIIAATLEIFGDEIKEKSKKKLKDITLRDLPENGDFFPALYDLLWKFFIDLHIIAATLEIFGDEIKEKSKKKLKDITLRDFVGSVDEASTEEEEQAKVSGLWKQLYPSSELDFVMKEMDDQILSPFMKEQPLQPLCERTLAFLSEYSASNHPGHFMQFSQLLARFVIEEATNDDGDSVIDNANIFSEEVLGAVVLLLNDKKEFLKKLHVSMRKAPATEIEREAEDEIQSPQQSDADLKKHAFERIAALMVVSVSQLKELVSDDVILSKEDKKQIEDVSSRVQLECGRRKVDKVSAKLCEQFFHYFFAPRSGGGCCECDPADGGIMGLFGKMFGGLCK